MTKNNVDLDIQYKSYSKKSFRDIHQLSNLSEEEKFAIEVVGTVLPFKVNNYVVDQLIDWDNYKDDPIFRLTFPQKDMLKSEYFDKVAAVLKSGADKKEIEKVANEIRLKLNPHPAGQQTMNVPSIEGDKLTGVQHKYDETMLFFATQGQTCHAFCTFCFRWPQFVGMDEMKFAMRESELIIKYLQENPQITDLLFTGGDPMIMRTRIFKKYIDDILAADIPNLKTIRIGTKSLSYWPYRFTSQDDAQELLDLFKTISDSGIHLAIMSHFNHPNELKTDEVKLAIANIRATGAQIRTQSPVMRNINDNSEAWAEMWKLQVELGLIPYYMFIARDTGAQHYFAIKLERAWEIFRNAYNQVSGICRTVRGPSMSAGPGKVQVLGVNEINGEKIFVLQFLQGRNADWVARPFFAKYDADAIWLDDLKPAFSDEFFFTKEYNSMLK